MFSFPIDDEVELRLHEEYRAEELFALIDNNREHLGRWFPWVANTRKVGDTLQFIKDARRSYVSNEAIPTSVWCQGRLAGTLSLSELDHHVGSGELGYWLGSDFEGKGIITRSCRVFISYAFDILALNRIVIRCRRQNRRSRAIAERLGFIREGILRESTRHNGASYDLVVYSVLRSEWAGAL